MRIGTWNLAGRRSAEHVSFLMKLDCDVLLLTEVSESFDLPGYTTHRTDEHMISRRHWAAVLSRVGLVALPDPHPASAMACVGDLTVCSSVLPWRSCGTTKPWVGENHAAKTGHAVDALLDQLPSTPLVWGGDWNHAMEGREWAGSKGGRDSINRALTELQLRVPTAELPHQIEGLLSIDHIAIPAAATAAAEHVSARQGTRRLSDHDAYIVQADPSSLMSRA